MEHPIEDQILSLLKRHQKDFLSISQIRTGLPAAALRQFGLGKSSAPSDIVKAFSPFMGSRLRQYKQGRSYYIGLNISAEELILNAVRRRPGLSSKLLCKSIPIPKKELIEAINRMLGRYLLISSISELHSIYFRLKDEKPPVSDKDDRLEFKAAYDKIGKGRGFVRIHQIREALNWSEERFDSLLKKLMAEYIIELHGGDPSQMNRQQIDHSFTDDKGRLYITLTWWGGK